MHTHNDNCYKVIKTITAKYDADIHSNFPIKDGDKTIWWVVPEGCQSFVPGNNLGTIDTMPGENITFEKKASESGAKIYYYVETLNGEAGDTTHNGKNYKQYNKLKTAEFHLREQIEKAENERAYLESVLQELSQAETEQEFNEIRRELQETNYIRKSSGKKELKRAFAPRTFKTSSGLEVLVGRSNVQNDQLKKKADKRDYWFHTQHIHGSHVILRCAGLTPSDDDLREAAMLASYFSQAKESSNVPVDYCPVKFVKKPAGARPGMVTYDNYRTLYVTPEEGLVKKLFLR